ncbi:CoA transferase [Cupriavidus basilensis]|uniref:CoA transferase n=1 Tax=Cupriavidus basilensis TaxID=68895 RepID=A0ABT6AWN4_9BURK|nr:CoA transferase [Cupriavidus basilensis]MDF3837035.1 CoA transferase [Cupriavidus basilensis]
MLGDSLSGVRVVDFTQVAAGPVCTHTLADLGADVIKVEAPQGELGRALAPFVEGQSLAFLALNGNKRSVALDLKDPPQREAALQLAAGADVVVESFRPGVMQRLGLGYEDVRQRNPDVIYCSVSAYGQQSAWRHKPGVDGVLQAASGLMSVTGLPDAPPCKVQVPIVDMVTGYMAAIGVLGALARRARDGAGQWLDIGMFASAVALQESSFASFFADGVAPERIGSAAPYAAPNEAVRCADGWIMLAAYHPSRWEALCEVLACRELLSDPRFLDLPGRIAHRKELVALLEERMTLRPRSEWLQRFEAVDIICAPINDYAEAVASPAFTGADLAEMVRHPVAGDLTLPRTPLRAVGEVPRTRRPAPLVGEHTREVLLEAGVPLVGPHK